MGHMTGAIAVTIIVVLVVGIAVAIAWEFLVDYIKSRPQKQEPRPYNWFDEGDL